MWTTVIFALLSGVGGVIAARALGPSERGLLAVAVVWSTVVGSLAAYGIPTVATYFVSRTSDRRPQATSTVLAVALVPATFAAVSGCAVVAIAVHGPARLPLLLSFVTVIPGIVGGAALGSVLGLGDVRVWGLMRILLPALALGLTLLVVSSGAHTATAITAVTAVASTIEFAALLTLLGRRRMLCRPERRLVRPVSSYMWKSVVSGAGFLISTQMDQLVMSFTVPARQLGLYAVAASFCAIVLTVASSSGPVVAGQVAGAGASGFWPALLRALTVTGFSACVMAGVAIVVAPELLTRVFGVQYSEAAGPMRILMGASVLLSLSAVVAEALRGLGRPLLPARSEAIGALLTCVLLLLLLKPYGLEGAALASLISYATVFCLMLLSTRGAVRSALEDTPALQEIVE